MGVVGQTLTLLLKNCRLKWRKKKSSFVEMLLPIAITGVLIGLFWSVAGVGYYRVRFANTKVF